MYKAEFYRLLNTVQEYDWGSRTAIPELLGQASPADKPQAELWMGAHPKAPSRVLLPDGGELPLPELIARKPARILGNAVAAKFGDRLPFLFKVLAASHPLSIQAHPNRKQAQSGFRKENEQGLPLDSFRRNYRDDNHKPEVICALTPFWALNGFRPIPEILDLLRAVGLKSIGKQVEAFAAHPAGLKTFFASLMGLDREIRERVIGEALAWAKRELQKRGPSPIASWLLALQELYPGDIGVLSPLLLNLAQLEPGDTMFLEAGVLHAYLEGTGIELMANSDNVIRGGLTPKYIDVEELLSILRFEGRPIRLVETAQTIPGERIFQTPAEEFRLSEIRVDRSYRSSGSGSVEIMIVLRGGGRIEANSELALRQGDSLLIPAATGPYSIQGSLQLYKATVPV